MRHKCIAAAVSAIVLLASCSSSPPAKDVSDPQMSETALPTAGIFDEESKGMGAASVSKEELTKIIDSAIAKYNEAETYIWEIECSDESDDTVTMGHITEKTASKSGKGMTLNYEAYITDTYSDKRYIDFKYNNEDWREKYDPLTQLLPEEYNYLLALNDMPSDSIQIAESENNVCTIYADGEKAIKLTVTDGTLTAAEIIEDDSTTAVK